MTYILEIRGGARMGRTLFIVLFFCFLYISSPVRTALWGVTTEVTKDIAGRKVEGLEMQPFLE
jgi:hypothetical protein